MINFKRALALGLAALTLGGGLAEPEAEYLVDMTPEEVLQVEQRLEALGFLPVGANEVFDADTRMAIESFQQANGLEVSGRANGETLDRLLNNEAVSRQDYLQRFANAYAQMTPLEKGSANNDVQVMQRKLREYGYFSGEADGVFGDATQKAVESFQMVNGLEATGVADGATLMRLMADAPITWPAYLAEMSAAEGDSGLNVYVLQKKLRQLGYFQGECTGGFGALTRRAVARFQSENGLEPTGMADAAMWSALFSGAAVSFRKEGTLQIGDYGEDVRRVQQRLRELGYTDQSVSGTFDTLTETAVRLYQMAAGLASTGELDADAQARLLAEDAPSLMDSAVRQDFRDQLDHADTGAHGAMAEIASRMLGTAFGDAEDALYPGFAFVQYVCVAAGLPVSQPEDLVRLANRKVRNLNAVQPGDVVAFQNTNDSSVTILLALGAGDGRILYTTGAEGWVVQGFIDQMEYTDVYRWHA